MGAVKGGSIYVKYVSIVSPNLTMVLVLLSHSTGVVMRVVHDG